MKLVSRGKRERERRKTVGRERKEKREKRGCLQHAWEHTSVENASPRLEPKHGVAVGLGTRRGIAGERSRREHMKED